MPVNRWKRRVFTCFILFHFASVGAYLLKDTGPGKTVRTATKWYERGLGIWQSWGMFSPNPPNGSSYLRATGITWDGQEVLLEVLAGQPEGQGIRWTYDRSLKFERSALNPKSKRSLREGYGLWLCERAKNDGLLLERVEMWKERVLHVSVHERPWRSSDIRDSVRVDLQVIPCSGSI